MKCDNHNWADVKKYFEETYIKYAPLGEGVFYVENVTDSSVQLRTQSGESHMLSFSQPFVLDYILPHKACFQYKKYAVLLQRRPARMWKKGLTTKNCFLASLQDRLWLNTEVDFNSYLGFINKPSYINYFDALSGFKEGSLISAALSPRISMDYSKDIYVDTVKIGHVAPSLRKVKVHPLFIDEVQQIFSTFKVQA